MAITAPSEFKFRRADNIGAASAEEDTEFLKDCFVQTEAYDILKNINDIRQIVLGRTGTGKSALFERLKQEEPDRVIGIQLHELALTYVSNSSVIRYFSDLGVNLDPFYKLLWRHVLTVELLKRHYASHANSENGGLWTFLTEKLSSQSRKNKDAQQAIQYLKRWDEKFWVEVDYRVKEITRKMENDLTKQLDGTLKSRILSGKALQRASTSLSDEERIEVTDRGQRVVSDSQVQDLSKVQQLLRVVLSDRQKHYYILIDRLDEDWVEDKLRYRLIMALLDCVREITRVPRVKALVAIRRDLIDRVFRLVRKTGAGFQEEKYQSLYLPLDWTDGDLIELLDKRIGVLVARRYQKSRAVTYRDLLPRAVGGTPIVQFVTNRAKRPRDVISLFNKCIEVAEGKARVNVDALKRAEGEYSRQRLRALGDEWHADYPGLLDFVDVLKKRTPSFPLVHVSYDNIAEVCLNSAIEFPNEAGTLREYARSVAEGLVDVSDFKRTLFMVFYRVGLVGLKLETFESASWVDESGQSVSVSEIDDSTGVVVHTTYWRALGIDTKRRR